MRLKVSDRSLRNPLWNKQRVLGDLKLFGSIRTLCKHYGTEEHWRAYYSDIWKWCNPKSPDYDQEFKKHMDEWLEQTGKKRSGGRPKKDVFDGWKQDYRKWIVQLNGNRVKAAEKTPYSWETIAKMVTPDTSEYDKELAEQVALAYQELAAKAEEATFQALDSLVLNPTPEQAKISQAQGWLATKILEKVDKSRWGREQTVNHKGKVQHQLLPSDTVIAQLAPAQQRYFGKGVAKTLPPVSEALNASGDVIEAEYVESESDSD